MIGARGHEHRRGDHRGRDRRQQAGAEQEAAGELGGAGGEGEERAGAQSEGLHVAPGALQAIAAEPPEELLRAVADEQGADDDTNDEQADFHGSVPL